ncbi:MAG: YcjX family protein [Hyphomicrobium aestuarii]|nr:YcjX family protein [Hyphomicrobium aestuarii]
MSSGSLAGTLSSASDYVAGLMTPTVRLGVTGLSRSGKTVFITALVRALTEGGRLPFFRPAAEGRILRAYLEPQPDDSLPRFDYERHLATLTGLPPAWPDSTRRISQLRLTIEYEPSGTLRRMLGLSRMHLDIVDYPGEWLLDLALLDKPFNQWSRETLAVLGPERGPHTAPLLDFLARIDPSADPEMTALHGAEVYKACLASDRASDEAQATLGPGRFLMPGDLDGSPLLTFFPMPSPGPVAGPGAKPSALQNLLARRYESYRTKVVMPFFREHFAKLDRQIVLVDALGAINRGAAAMADLERALTSVMRAFRPGAAPWLQFLLGSRIDRVLFAATKADHIHHGGHGRLEAILKLATEKASTRAEAAGAAVSVLAMAAVRATREAEIIEDKQTLHVIMGTPMPGERIAGKTFDGSVEAGVFPGDLPADAAKAFDPSWARADDTAFVRFRPPTLGKPVGIQPATLPHIRLDRALDILLGDKL